MEIKRQIKIGLFIYIICSAIHALGQTVDKQDRLNIYVNTKDVSIRANAISIQERKVRIDKNKTYFWYSNNQIFQTKEGYDGKLLDGDYTSYYQDNNLREKGYFKMGLKHGEWKTWYESGKLNECTQWKNGFRNGSYEIYNNNGEKVLSSIYKNDKLNGKEIKYDSGKIISIRNFKNGVEIIPEHAADSNNSKNKNDSIFKEKKPLETVK